MNPNFKFCNQNLTNIYEMEENKGLPAVTGKLDQANTYEVFPKQLVPWRPTIISYNCYFVSTLLGYPLDTIKTRVQAYNYPTYWYCIKKTYKNEGLLGFCHGIWTPVFSTAAIRSFNISVYTKVKPKIYEMLYSQPSQPNLPVSILTGNIAGTLTAMVSAPFEYCKIYNQVINLEVGAKSNNNFFHISRDIIKHQGVNGLYSGAKYHILRDFIGSAVYYSIYESFKPLIYNQLDNNKLAIAIAGGLAGISSWSFIFPIDTIKAKYQKDSVANVVRSRKNLPPLPIKVTFTMSKQLYRGLGLSITRSCLTSMVFFSLYEISMAKLI